MSQQSLTDWLDTVRRAVAASEPSLLATYETYAAETEFGRWFISADTDRLKPGARIIEIGAGTLLLACQLVREGFHVTALDPVGSGFSHFNRLQQIARECAEKEGILPQVELPLRGEDLTVTEKFDFAFSVNVMEHVDSPAQVIQRVADSLNPGGYYRFMCANYLFPYEPHFNIPTLFSRKLTYAVMRKQIVNGKVPDPQGTWDSLNWINVVGLKRAARRLGLKIQFSRSLMVSMLARVVTDPIFASRRSPAVAGFISLLVRLKLHYLAALVPAAAQPIMDCKVYSSTRASAA